MSPDAINEVLASDRYEYSCGEAIEALLISEAAALARRVGPDDMKQLIILCTLPIEADLRASNPNHPALPFLDEYHEEERRLGRE
jgi:hypothetical protein